MGATSGDPAGGTWTILSPVARPPVRTEARSAHRLDRPIAGVRVGLEVDYAWISYTTVIDEWDRLLRADGALPDTLWLEHSREEADRPDPEVIRARVEDWSKLVDCGVVGLGN